MNAAMVVENSFWLWFEHSSFVAQANSGQCPKPYKQVRALSSTTLRTWLSILYTLTCLNGYDSPCAHPVCGWGQRPSVIIRGQAKSTLPTGSNYGVVTVYLLRMDRIIFSGGGVQYQQLAPDPGGEAAGWFDFESCTQDC
jgi:hypothetical protein